jgi:MFS family permease
VRTPVRKALMAAAVTPATYGRAFGFERMMDTCGAIIGPLTALALLNLTGHSYPRLFALTLIPGVLAAACIGFGVKESERKPVPHISFGESLRALPKSFRRFLVGVGLFGLGDFAHTLLILLATQKLAPQFGMARAASFAVGLYVLHNVFYAAFSYIAGWLADHLPKRPLLVAGYSLAAVMTVAVVALPASVWALGVVFVVGGIYVAIEETLEDSFCAELVAKEHHGMAFGTLATVNGIGDCVSSVVVGALWSAVGLPAAMVFSGVLFVAGALVVATTPQS